MLLDLSAAFDTLDHAILLKSLHDIGVRHTVLEWFKSYLDDRTFTVKIGQTMSARSEVRCGVPQGSVLGPMLFNVYCLPIGDTFAKHNVRYHIYADDTQLYVECPPNDHTDASRQITECTGVNRPAFGGTVPHFHQMSRDREMRQMSRIFRKLHYYFFLCRLFYIFAL